MACASAEYHCRTAGAGRGVCPWGPRRRAGLAEVAEVVLADEQGRRRAHGGHIQAAILGDEVPARPPPSRGRAGAGAQGWVLPTRRARS